MGTSKPYGVSKPARCTPGRKPIRVSPPETANHRRSHILPAHESSRIVRTAPPAFCAVADISRPNHALLSDGHCTEIVTGRSLIPCLRKAFLESFSPIDCVEIGCRRDYVPAISGDVLAVSASYISGSPRSSQNFVIPILTSGRIRSQTSTPWLPDLTNPQYRPSHFQK